MLNLEQRYDLKGISVMRVIHNISISCSKVFPERPDLNKCSYRNHQWG